MNKPLQFQCWIVVLIVKPIETGKLHPFPFNCKYGLKGHLMKAFAAEILRLLLKH